MRPRTLTPFLPRSLSPLLPRSFILTLCCLFLFLSTLYAQSARDRSPKTIPRIIGDTSVVFLSDSQEPIFFETLVLPENNNEQATQLIFDDVLRTRPNAVVHLGDMVALGFDSCSWEPLDIFRLKLWKQHIPFFPTLGNHELMFYWKTGEENFMDRFPFYSKTGYQFRIGKLAIVLLNSNISKLSDDEKGRQNSWYEQTLNDLEKDSTIRMIIVGCHHSPYTNSTIVTPSEDVQKLFLPAFIDHPKCKLFISGHAHASEHFKQQGKDLLVIGGGGGLQQPLLTGKDQRWEDLTPMKTEKRMFHYLECHLTADGIVLTAKRLKKDFSGFETSYTFSLGWE